MDTIYVLPTIVESDTWHNPEQALSQDVDESGVYQSFTRSNSASFGSVLPGEVNTPSENNGGQENRNPSAPEQPQESVSPENNTSPVESPEEQLPEDSSGTTVTEPSVEEVPAEVPAADEPAEPSAAEPVSSGETPEAAPEAAEPTALQTLSTSFFRFTNISNFLLPLAQESVITSLEEETEEVAEETPAEAPAAEEDAISEEETGDVPETPAASPEAPQEETPADTGTSTSNETAEEPAVPEVLSPVPVSGSDEGVPEPAPAEPLQGTIMFDDFALPQLDPGQLIRNAQLRMSLGGLVEVSEGAAVPSLEVEYTTGTEWMSAGAVLLDGEVSNALNGGYYLFALSQLTEDELDDFAVRVSYRGETEGLERIYIDSVWLQIDTETFNRGMLKERLLPKELRHLTAPTIYEMLSADVDFDRNEVPRFSLRYESQRNFFIQLIRNLFGRKLADVVNVTVAHTNTGPVPVTPKVNVTGEGLITVQLREEDKKNLPPGEYAVTITVDEGGKTFSDTFSFQWGLLSVNPDQTEYELGDESTIALGALTRNGNTLCDARLSLYLIDPNEYFHEVPVTPSGLCSGNNVIDVPDYSASFTPNATGTYTMYVERLDQNGAVLSHTQDTFHVVDAHDVSVKREGPTRIYPPAPYPMRITVAADRAFEGTFTERVPRTFTILDTDAQIDEVGDVYELTWQVALAAGEETTFSYSFDAPDLSPYLYNLGPATLESDRFATAEPLPVLAPGMSSTTGTTTAATTSPSTETSTGFSFTEHRAWQIASDATGNMLLFWDGTGGIPAGWTCVSCTSGDTFYQRFIQGSSTYNGTGGATTHTHTVSTSVLATSGAATENVGGATISTVSHSHTLTPTIAAASNLPAYRQIRVIQYTASAGEPASIPTGAIGIFDTSVPAGWTQYNDHNGRYIYGEGTVGTTGGSDTHQHSVSGTTGGSGGTTVGNRGPDSADGAAAGHTHTVSSSSPSLSNEPPYITVMLGKIDATSTAPNGLITMWTDEVPASWIDVSSDPGDPFNGKFLKATSTYGSTGGASSHAHADMNGIVSSAPNTTVTNARTGATGASAVHTHGVNVTNFSTADNLPPYVTAVLGKRQGNNPLFTAHSYRWYVNANVQTPIDAWPSGATDLAERAAIRATSTPVKNGDIIRLRVSALVGNATATASTTMKLQYASTTSTCSAVSSWNDVGSATSSVEWRGHNNTSVSDHSTIATSTLASTTVNETYEENGYSVPLPNDVPVGDVAEWDFVLRQNGASAGATYCFRMIESDGTPFYLYSTYPQLLTNYAPIAPTPSKLFNNEKTASTSPWFEFVTTDPESQDLNYQIQVDNNADFSSAVIDDNTVDDSTLFLNLVTPADKDPFTSGQLMRYTPSASLTNGVTYWWRVRARDPQGSNQWGDWSTERSFTIDTALTASAWFQTTEEQFDTSTLDDLDAVGTDQVQLATGSSTGSMTTELIDFEYGSLGTAWDSLSWNDTETAGDIVYHVEYLAGDTWSEIPDVDLPGNSSGFDASPVNLLDLDTDTYNDIRVVADFTDAGGTPSLQDITVSWGYRVETPTITRLFSNEKVGTTTPTFEFTTSDPQGDDLTYQVSWSTDYTFAASTTRTSDADGGFVNADFGSNFDPFTSGDTIQFTLEGADALTNNTTYWWRVRAKDTTGDNAYSLWTEARSFTVDTTVTVSTWFQTTQEQFDTNTLSGTVALSADSVSVATTATQAMLVYGEGVETEPRYREWSGSAWGSEGRLQDVGAPIKWAVVKAGITREEYVAATLGTDADVNVQVFSLGSWGNLQEVTSAVTDISGRGFDIAYETVSGDALVAYCDGDADPSYYIWNGSSWTSGGTINLGTANNCAWVRLASDPTSDEIILLARDTTGGAYEAQVWNGSSWGNSTTLGSIGDTTNEGMAVEYEESGGQAIVISSDGNPARFRYNTWNGTAWSGAATQAIGNDFEWGQLARDAGSDELALCYLDEDQDIGMIHWTGAAWTGQTELDIDGNAKNDPAFSCVYETTSGRDNYVMTVYSDSAATNYSYWNNASWSTEAQVNTIGDSATMKLIRTGIGAVLGIFFDDPNDDLLAASWNGTSWSSTVTIESNASVDTSAFGHPYDMVPRNARRDGTVIVSPAIEFTDGVGPYWDAMTWNDTTPGTSDILYSIQYYDDGTDTWAFIPDVDLPGNTAGTTTSPIDLSNLNVSTYGTIRPYAELSCDNSSNCPSILDWSVTWTEGIVVSGTLHEYDQVSSTTAGTVAVAVDGVLQVGKSGTVSNGVWSISNVTTFAGDIITVFVNGVSEADEAVGITRYDGAGDITGLSMYERHLSLGSDDATTTPFTNADIGLYDFTNDEDIFANATGTALAVCVESGCSDAEIIVKTGAVYRPGGSVLTHDFENNGTFEPQGNTITLSGTWDNNATATMATSTVVFSATSTAETVDSTGALVHTFYNITFGSVASTASWQLTTDLDVDNNLSVQNGTLSRAGATITIAGNLSTGASGLWSGIGSTTFDGAVTRTWSDASAGLQNVGNVFIDGTSKTIQLASNVKANNVTVGADDIFDASTSNYDITVLGNWQNNNTFVARAGEVFMSATTTNKTIDVGGDAFYDLTIDGAGGTWSFSEAALAIGNDFTVATGTITMPTGTTTVAGSWDTAGGTFAHNNATISLTSGSSETISAGGTAFTNNFYNLTFSGAGSWSFADANATTSNNFRIQQGTVTLPSGTLAVGNNFMNTAGTFAHNNGTVRLTGTGTHIIDTNSSFNNLSFTGSGSWSFADAGVTAVGSLTVSNGSLTLPSGTFTIGGSFTNDAAFSHNSGTILFNSADTGETIDAGASPFSTVTINGVNGGWTIADSATTTGNFTLTAANAFTLASGETLSVGGVFTNSVGGAATTWTGSVLSLESGNYSVNTKTASGDAYETLRVQADTDIKMWNSSAGAYDIDGTGSLYSQDHAGVDGDLYVFGSYERTSGNEYWSYATDFDGTVLGGSSRQVDVRFAAGSDATISGSLFEVLGGAGASTTVANQGSGAYTVLASAATTTFTYYDFDHLGLTGVTLDGSGHVAALDDGSFTPGVNGGTALTVSSSTINANPGLQIQRVDFSTTTPISAANVTQTDGTPASYWWFRNSTGNLDGEAFDNDTGDPGSIRWDDSSLTVTMAGTVYEDDGSTPMGGPTCDDATPNIRIVVTGGSSYTGSCASADGTYSISDVVIVGDPVIITYLDTNGGAKGTVVTKTPTGNINDLNIYANRVMTRHEDASPLTILDMARYDSDDDTDISYTAATGTLLVFKDTELHIASSTTFAPGGDITIFANASGTSFDGSLHIDDNAVFTGSGTSTYTVGGSFTMDAGASFSAASSTVLMNATTTGKTITTTGTQEITFNTLVFNGSGGGWNINGDVRAMAGIDVTAGTVSGTGDITVVNGSLSGNGLLSMGSGTTTIHRTNTLGGTTPWTFGNLVLGNGSVTGTTTPGSDATTTVLGRLTIRTGHYLDAGASHWDLAGTGTVFVEQGTFLEDTSTVRYSGTGAANILSTTYYDLDLMAQGGAPTYTATGLGIIVLNDLTIGGPSTTTVTFNTNDPAVDVNGDVVIDSTGVLQGSGSAAFTVGGSWDNNGSYTANGGTVTFDNGGASTIAAGSSSFANVVINGGGSFTFSEHATATNAFTLTNAGAFTLDSGRTLAVGGTFGNSVGGAATTWTGSVLSLYGGGNYSINAKTTSDVYETLRIGSATQIRMWQSSAAAYDIHSTGSLYSQDHAGVDGDLYVFGAYTKTSGNDFWNYVHDFDGTVLGSPRNVDVYVRSGSSILYTGGGLSVIGSSSASTTVQNQGSGTYSLRIGGTASTSWSYYEVRDTDASGLTFSGTPNVVTLSRGDFEVGVEGGSALTVGGTVINQNQAKTFTDNTFSTSTGIASAFNVTATGTTVSSWRFTNHRGVIDGESYDVDPNGDPGYIVWDDSAALITISGTVYSDEGSTLSGVCDGSTQNIRLRVAGLTSYTTSCNATSSAYSIGNVAYSPGDSLVVYIDGETEKAATVSEDPVSNISDMHLYENRVIVRHENTNPLSIADMAVWDSSDDADIPFTAVDGAPDTLTLPSDRKLIVWANKEFEPGGNVTLSGGGAGAAYDGTLELYAGAIFDATGAESHSIGGSFIAGAGSTFDDETSTFTFTTTGAGRTIDTNEYPFYNAVFNGSGSWTVANTAFDVGNDLTISQGAVTFPNGTTTITGSLLTTGGSFIANGGNMVFNSAAAESVRAGSSSFNALTFSGTGSYTLQGGNATATADVWVASGTFTSATGTFAIGGDFINDATFNHGSGVLRFTSATGAAVTAGNSDLYSVTFAGSGSHIFTDEDVALLGSLSILGGDVTLATGTMSVGGSFLSTGGLFDHASGTILFNSSNGGESINPGASPFNIVSFASAGGGWTITGDATTTGNFSLVSASNFTQSSSTRLTVGGVFTNLVGGAATTWTGSTLAINSGSGYTINTKATGGDLYHNLLIGSSTALRMWDSTGNITLMDADSSLYSQDHAGVSGSLYIFGDYVRGAGADYWSYATDFDGTALGGSSRQAFVYFADGASTTITGGALNIIGANGFDTTVSNQGSGMYGMNILGGTFNAQYYSFANMGATGLVLSGATTVSSLTEGNFTLGVDGGSLITLASTTLNFNAGLVVSGASFATTSAITGYNVNLIGTTPSAWTFTGHSGNLDGESFDNDGGTACGSLRWDDSSCLLTTQSAYRWRNDDGGEGVPNSEWYDLDWSKRKRVRVTNADASPYTDAAVKLTVTYDADMQADFEDLRFTEDDGVTPTDHFIESYTASTEAVVWVKVPALPASSDAEVYMYYGNGAVSDASATTTFSFMDDFEDGNISEYSGDTGIFSVDGTFAYEGAYGLDATGNESGKATDGIYRNNVTVAQGETLRYMQYIDTGAGSGDETCTMFGVQSPGSNNQNYAVCLELFGVDRVSISKDVDFNDTSGTVLASTTISYVTGWHEVEIDWGTDDSISVTVSQDGTVVATTSATDSSYTQGGVGFTFWFQNGGWDIYSSRPLLLTEPAVTVGAEQVSGGASWIAAVNSPATGIEENTNVRVRFLVENTGLAITAQNFELEFAPKGGAPSCEAVNYNNYVEVPDAATCGTSDICMSASPNITNLESTTDLLGGDGTFTPGQVVEDPSNNTGNLDVDANEFTELEYVLVTTENVTDSLYCLRVTDEGADLDSYARVAELQLIFIPNITSLTLNGGLDITLTGGATTTVTATGTVSDLNGYADLADATTTIFRSGVGEACSADNNNCYVAGPSSCSFVNCAGTSCEVECTADIYYHADPTDIGTFAGETWRALLSVSDQAGSVATATAPSIDLLTLRAIAVDSSIDYGTLAVNADTGSYNATTTVENIGNDSIDVAIEGTDLTDGAASAIPVSEQIFATSTFTYSACTFCSSLSTSTTNFELNLSKPTSTAPAVIDEVFWGISVPFGVAGTPHTGTNTFYAVGD